MAISKVKPIKKTLKKAIDYIIDPNKTKDGLLVSTFACSTITADTEMALTAAKGKEGRIAYHMMQSFSPKDNITPEKAHELGKEFADRMLGGKYEYVISTHIDKGHCHNHIIFNATSFVDHKKYHMPKNHKDKMFRINDQICRENNLSVIENPGANGKSWYKCAEEKKTNWRNKLKEVLDKAVTEAVDYISFISIMEREGYEYEETPKTLKFRAAYEGQNKFTRVDEDNYGEYYTKEILLKRITDKEFNQSIQENLQTKMPAKADRKTETAGRKNFTGNNKINMIIDISKNVKAQQSAGYENALNRANMNTTVKSMNYLIQHNIQKPDQFRQYAEDMKKKYEQARMDKQQLDKDLLKLSEQIKFSQNFKKYQSIYQTSQRTGSKEFAEKHKNELILFQAAKIYFNRNDMNPDKLNLGDLFEEYRHRKQEKKPLEEIIKQKKEEYKELQTVEKNIAAELGIILSDQKKEKSKEEGKSEKREK